MYLGTSVTGAIGGTLLTILPGYWGISAFTATTFTLALGIYWQAGAFQRQEQAIV